MPSLPRIPFDDRSRSAGSPTSHRIGGVLLLLKRGASSWYRGSCPQTRRSSSELLEPNTPRLFGKTHETAALQYQARPSRRAYCRRSMASISREISGIVSRPREPIAAEIGSCANDLTATTLIIRLSADNGTIRRHSTCKGSRNRQREGRRIDCPPVIEAAPSVR